MPEETEKWEILKSSSKEKSTLRMASPMNLFTEEKQSQLNSTITNQDNGNNQIRKITIAEYLNREPNTFCHGNYWKQVPICKKRRRNNRKTRMYTEFIERKKGKKLKNMSDKIFSSGKNMVSKKEKKYKEAITLPQRNKQQMTYIDGRKRIRNIRVNS